MSDLEFMRARFRELWRERREYVASAYAGRDTWGRARRVGVMLHRDANTLRRLAGRTQP